MAEIENDPVKRFVKPGVQCFHGGQSYRQCPNFKMDFSVTTNLSGPPNSSLVAAMSAFDDIEHYPDQDAWVARCTLADVLKIPPDQILLGNGASEFIDIVPRLYPRGCRWRPGPWAAQFMEYERAATNAGHTKVPWDQHDAELTIMINPNSPTGDVIPFNDLRELIKIDDKSTFIIDESFIMCYGPTWMEQSATHLIEEFGDRVIVIASWTKVLACPLVRLGTVIASKNIISKIAEVQVPWSVNGIAQAYMIAALHDENYFQEMWCVTPIWKQIMHDLLKEVGFRPNENSPLWVPYVYVDMLTPEITTLAEKVAFDAGYPVRNCTSFGRPHHVRLGVRLPVHARGMAAAFKANKELMDMIDDFHKKEQRANYFA